MSFNTFGHQFRVTTWGESHGAAIGVVVDGCPPGLVFDLARDVQSYLDTRRPGQSRHTTQRREPDIAKVLSGVVDGADGLLITTGTPLHLTIDNVGPQRRQVKRVLNAMNALAALAVPPSYGPDESPGRTTGASP